MWPTVQARNSKHDRCLGAQVGQVAGLLILFL